MAEVAHAGEHHGHAALVGGVNDFLVAHGAARLGDAGSACIDHHVQAVAEGEEGIAGHHGALQRQVGQRRLLPLPRRPGSGGRCGRYLRDPARWFDARQRSDRRG